MLRLFAHTSTSEPMSTAVLCCSHSIAWDLIFRFRCFKYLILRLYTCKKKSYFHITSPTRKTYPSVFHAYIIYQYLNYRRHRLNEELQYSAWFLYILGNNQNYLLNLHFSKCDSLSGKLILLVHLKTGSLQISYALDDVLSQQYTSFSPNILNPISTFLCCFQTLQN